MKTIIACIILAGSFFTGCNTTNSPANNSTSSEQTISGINWYLKKIYLPEGNIDIKEKRAFIKFDADKNAAGGNGGCNTFGSNYKINDNNVDFKNVFSTKMFCEKYQQQENNFFSQLEKITRYEMVNGKLVLYKDNDALLEFEK